MYAVITENDESQWMDKPGESYHFPKRYSSILKSGTLVIYYKGKCKNNKYSKYRLSDFPHYFGVAKIGGVYKDEHSDKGDLFAVIEDFIHFKFPVDFKTESGYLENIPENKKTNYWRDGVRIIEQDIYELILAQAIFLDESDTESKKIINKYNDCENGLESEPLEEGAAKQKFVTLYERNPKLRRQALVIHGDTCFACGFNFQKIYGEYGRGYIHIHHTVPVSELGGGKVVNPETDMVPLCANCHAIIHRRKDQTLSVDELKEMIRLCAL